MRCRDPGIGKHWSKKMMRIIVTAALVAALNGCGAVQHWRKQEELSAQITADADRCRQGNQNACRLYLMEIQRCSLLSTDPVCQNG
jgi:hypothetical protein